MKSLIKGINDRIWNVALKTATVLFVICALLFAPLAGNLDTSAVGGSYSINFAAADPDIYIPLIPFPPGPCPTTGRGSDPIPDAYWENPVTPNNNGVVNSLAPDKMALGQIVPFEILITVKGDTTPENGVIEFTAGWSTEVTNGVDFGYDESYGVLCAFVDTADGAHDDVGGDATVDTFSWVWVDTTPQAGNDEIQGTFIISGLDYELRDPEPDIIDVVVVEVWVVLDNTWIDGTGGNVASRLISARTLPELPDPPETISTGAQTVPLLQVKDFETNKIDLSITKSDDPDPIYVKETAANVLTYTILATNDPAPDVIANGVVISDTLDSYTTFISGTWAGEYNNSDDCTHSLGEVTCTVGSMLPGETVTAILQVEVLMSAPKDGTIREPDCYVGEDGVDLCNAVSIEAINDETDYTNNRATEPTDVIWDPTAVTMGPFTAEAKYLGAIHLDWTTFIEDGIEGFNIYRGINSETWPQQVNPELIPAQGVGGGVGLFKYTFVDPDVTAGVTYYYLLKALDTSGQEDFLDTDQATGLYGAFIPIILR